MPSVEGFGAAAAAWSVAGAVALRTRGGGAGSGLAVFFASVVWSGPDSRGRGAAGGDGGCVTVSLGGARTNVTLNTGGEGADAIGQCHSQINTGSRCKSAAAISAQGGSMRRRSRAIGNTASPEVATIRKIPRSVSARQR